MGGEILYHGPVLAAANRFSALGHPCPPAYNHADWLLETLVMSKLDDAQRNELHMEFGPNNFAPFGRAAYLSEATTTTATNLSAKTATAVTDPKGIALPWRLQALVLLQRGWRISRGSIWSNELAILNVRAVCIRQSMRRNPWGGRRSMKPNRPVSRTL